MLEKEQIITGGINKKEGWHQKEYGQLYLVVHASQKCTQKVLESVASVKASGKPYCANAN